MGINICEEGITDSAREAELSSALKNIGATFTSPAGFEERIRLVLAEAVRATCSEGAGIAVSCASGFAIRFIHNLPPEFMGRTVNAAAAISEGPDRLLEQIGLNHGMSLPLIANGNIIGFLFFSGDRLHRWNDFAQKTAVLISLALDNEQLGELVGALQTEAEEERALFTALLEEMPVGVIFAEAQGGKLIRANAQVERVWRRSFDGIPDVPFRLFKGYHSDGKPYAPEEWPLARSLSKGEIVNAEEIEIERADGTQGVMSASSSPIRDAAGRIVAGVGIYNDVTERRLARQAVMDSESKFRKMAFAAQDAVVLINNDGEVEFWNDAAEKMFLFTGDEIMGKPLHSYVMPDRYAADFNSAFSAFRLTGEGRFVGKIYEITALKKDGTEFPVELSMAAIRLRGKWNAIGIVRDITERKIAEQALKQTVDELKRSNRDLARFAHVASHDLQEPLRTVAGFVKLLRKKYQGKLDEQADKYISLTVDGAHRMSTLINDVLALSRVGTQRAEFRLVDLNGVFRQVMANLKAAIRNSRAEITSDRLPVMTGDETQLIQLLQNLIANAIKFKKTNREPRIHLSAEQAEREWIFGVKDNGIGIESENFDRIFAIFERLHTQEEYPGTGLGLALCKKIVERHGGRMWVESKPDEGSAFYFTLPVRRKEENDTKQRNGESS